MTSAPPPHTAQRSAVVTDRMSPNRYESRSTRSHDMRPIATSPKDSAECERIPSSASDVSQGRVRCRTTSAIAMATVTAVTPAVMFTDRTNPTATPSSAECAMVSPKYAIRRQMMKHPIGPAMTATPMPAATARRRKGSTCIIPVRGCPPAVPPRHPKTAAERPRRRARARGRGDACRRPAPGRRADRTAGHTPDAD